MKLNFDNIEMQALKEFKGGEGVFNIRMFSDGVNKIMRGVLPVGSCIGLHTHDTDCEMIYILSGDARCIYDDTMEYLKPGDCHYCPKGHSHSLINNSDTVELVFFSVIPEQ